MGKAYSKRRPVERRARASVSPLPFARSLSSLSVSPPLSPSPSFSFSHTLSGWGKDREAYSKSRAWNRASRPCAASFAICRTLRVQGVKDSRHDRLEGPHTSGTSLGGTPRDIKCSRDTYPESYVTSILVYEDTGVEEVQGWRVPPRIVRHLPFAG